MKDLRRRVVRGIAWRGTVDVSSMILQVGVTAVLARLLERSDFGLVAMALLVNRFLMAVTQIGFGSAIVQKRNLDQGHAAAVFWIQLVVNAAVALLCFALAPVAASFFQEPRLTSLVRVMSWIILINAGGFPQTMLRRDLRFGAFSALEIAAQAAGSAAALAAAFSGWGFWSLALQAWVSALLFSAGIWLISGWRPARPRFEGLSEIFRYGFDMLGSNVFNFFSQNLAAILMGRYIGTAALGSFNIAYNMAIVPAQKIQSIFASVLMPAFSRLHDGLDRFREKFRESLFALGLIFFPLMGGLAATSRDVVATVYGPKWSSAALFLAMLAPVGLCKGFQHLFNSLILARGWSSRILRLTVFEAGLSLPLLFIGAKVLGPPGLVLAYLVTALATFVVAAGIAQRAAQDSRLVAGALIRSGLAAAVMSGSIYALGRRLSFSPPVNLALEAAVGGILYGALRWILADAAEKERLRGWLRSRSSKGMRLD